MLRSKSFVKRTRKGNVVKVVKEHYLRDDIPCSSPICKTCTHTPVLSEEPKATSTFPPHYLVPDTNVFISQVGNENLQQEEFPVTKVIYFIA